MFGSTALEFAIAMTFIYLMLSLAVTSLQEGLAALARRRARTLFAGIGNLLRDPALTQRIYDHPLVRSLHSGARRPSYIPSRTFALALLDSVTPAGETPNPANVATAIKNGDSDLHAALRLLMADAKGDYDRFVENVEVWFNSGMERVSGWYKRYTQGILMAIGAAFAIIANIDSLQMACVLWKDSTVRATLVAEAQQIDTAPPPPPIEPEELADVVAAANVYMQPLRSVRLPLGWAEGSAVGADPIGCGVAQPWPSWNLSAWTAAVWLHWKGWLITMLAISLGSPFWFDLLNRFMSIRAGGKAPEERPKKPREEQPALGPGERPEEARRLDAEKEKRT
jgi:hypothetical protein